MRHLWIVTLAAALAAAGLPAAGAESGGRPPLSIENLKALYNETPILVRFQAEKVQANPTVAPRLVWEVQGPVIEVIKGKLLPGRISLHVDSIVRAFDLSRADVEGKEFVAPVKPLSEVGDRRYQLVGQAAFAAGGSEAQALCQLAETDAQSGATGGQGLELTVRPVSEVFPVVGAKVIEIRLTNNGKDSATYLQTPISEKEGRLYLMGQGMLRIRDTTGRTLPDKGNIVAGMAPPPPPKPALILPNANLVETIDLGKYYELPEGRYTLVLLLATPDGRGRVPSNGLSFQVGAVNLPDAPKPVEPVPVEPVPAKPEPTPAKPEPSPAKPEPAPPKPPEPAVKVPDPSQYKPGKASAGLAALLRPAKATFTLGDPVDLEFRLINEGPRTIAVDARLERTLTVQVTPVGDYPQPLVIRQVIPWPADEEGKMPTERALLREGAFWGRTVNLNVLYGKSLADLPAPTAEEISAGKNLTYERHGKHLFGFPKPGYYNVTATYVVARPPAQAGGPGPEQPLRDWWIGEVQTNTITIEIADKTR